jgi:hypothetical protein
LRPSLNGCVSQMPFWLHCSVMFSIEPSCTHRKIYRNNRCPLQMNWHPLPELLTFYFYVDLWILYADHIWLPFPHIDGSCGLPRRVTSLFLQGNPCPFLWTVIDLCLIWGQYFVGTSELVKKHLMITESLTWTQKMCQAIGLMSGHSNNPFTVSVCTHESLVKNFRQR